MTDNAKMERMIEDGIENGVKRILLEIARNSKSDAKPTSTKMDNSSINSKDKKDRSNRSNTSNINSRTRKRKRTPSTSSSSSSSSSFSISPKEEDDQQQGSSSKKTNKTQEGRSTNTSHGSNKGINPYQRLGPSKPGLSETGPKRWIKVTDYEPPSNRMIDQIVDYIDCKFPGARTFQELFDHKHCNNCKNKGEMRICHFYNFKTNCKYEHSHSNGTHNFWHHCANCYHILSKLENHPARCENCPINIIWRRLQRQERNHN